MLILSNRTPQVKKRKITRCPSVGAMQYFEASRRWHFGFSQEAGGSLKTLETKWRGDCTCMQIPGKHTEQLYANTSKLLLLMRSVNLMMSITNLFSTQSHILNLDY